MVSMQQLRYFVKVVDNGSLNKAAKTLYISQPALTKQVSELEKRLGCILLVRKNTGIELTEAGRYLYENASLLLAAFEQTIDGMRRFSERLVLRIGALPSLVSFYLPNVIHKSQLQDHFKIEISIRSTSDELITMVEHDQLDIAFVQDCSNHDRLKIFHLFQERYVVIHPLNHSLSLRSSVQPHDLAKEKMILNRDPCDIRKSFRRYFSQVGIEPNVVLELGFNASVVNFVSQGTGVSIVPSMVGENIQNPMVVVKELETQCFFGRTIVAVFHPEIERTVFQLLRNE